VSEGDSEVDNEEALALEGVLCHEKISLRDECDTLELRSVTVLQENAFRTAALRSCFCLVMYLAIHK